MQQENKKGFRTLDVGIISIAHFIHDVYSSFLAPILPLIIEKLSLSYFQVSGLWVIQRIPSLFNPFIGILADKLKVRYFVIFAPAITATTMSLVGPAGTYITVAVLLFCMGIGSAIFHVPAPVMIKRLSGTLPGRGMSFYMFGGELARTAGPIIITAAISWWSLEGTYWLIPPGILLSLMLYVRLNKIGIAQEMRRKKPVKGNAAKIFKRLYPFFILVAGFTFFRAGMKACLTTLLPTYLVAEGNSLWFGNTALATIQLAGAAGVFIWGSVSDKLGRKNTLLLTSLITPVFYYLFLIADGFWLYPALIAAGLFLFAPTPVFLAMVNSIKSDNPAFVNGLYIFVSFFISSLVMLVLGDVSDWIGLEQTFWYALFFTLGTIPFILFIREDKLPG